MYSHSIRRVTTIAALALLSGCGLGHQILGLNGGPDTSLGQATPAPSVFGYAVADEPEATLIARQILNQGGNAADAAAAAGFALSVTLPSRASLGGGGECLIKMQDAQGNPQPPVALLFLPGTPASTAGDRPAAIPSLARGLLALQARFGQLPASEVITPAERLAGGVQVSPALEADLTVVGAALLADPAAASVFGPSGSILPAGANLVQPDLAATLETLRVQGVQGISAGSYAEQFITAANAAGADLTLSDLANNTPTFAKPAISTINGLQTATLPAAPLDAPNLPATSSFITLDKNGGVVACAVTLNNLFGTGRIAAGTGILLAASPRTSPPAPLAADITTTADLTFRAASTGTGQAAISYHNAITCPGDQTTCTGKADPNGHGLAFGGE